MLIYPSVTTQAYIRGWTEGRPFPLSLTPPPLPPLPSPLSPSSLLGAASASRAQNFPLFPSLPFKPIFLPSPPSSPSSIPLLSLLPPLYLPLSRLITHLPLTLSAPLIEKFCSFKGYVMEKRNCVFQHSC